MIRGLLALVAAAGAFGAAPQSPPDVDATLTVRLAAGKSTYAMGEFIPLDLEFRGRAGPDYFFSTAAGDRLVGGLERYGVTPGGGSDDPMAELLSSVGVVGSVLSGWHPLDGSPFALRVHLNEWVRFTKPGTYRLVVESRRLERYSREPAPPVVASPVTLHIETAEPGWAAVEVARAVAALEGRGPGTAREGAAILRHLGTKDAALALVGHYGEGGENGRLDCLAGLVASPHRAEIVEAMEARLDAGDPLPPGFLRDLALLRSLLDRPGGSYADRFERQKAAECDYARRSLEGLGRGSPSAEALEAALAALEESPDPACETSLPSLLGDHPAAAREAFLALPRPTQALLLVRIEIDRDPACDLEAAALAYLLEHDPPPALRRLQPGFDRRRSGMCVVPPWSELAPRHWDEAVEAAAIAHLRGENPRLVSDAARILGAHGSRRAKGPLLDRLARWNEEWVGRESELAALVAGPLSLDSPVVLENALVNALLDGRVFSLTAEETWHVRELCRTRACRDNVDARARELR